MAYEDRIQSIAAQRKRAEAAKAPDRRFGQYETRMRNIARSGKGLPGDRSPKGEGLFSMVSKIPKPWWARGADLGANMLDALRAGEKARVGGKFNAPLNVKNGSDAYRWLLDDVIKDKYKDDFRKEVGKNNLHWTELNKFADDDFIGGGQLAKGINARNEGIIDTGVGKEAMDAAVNVGMSLHGTGPIGDAAADEAWLTRTGQPFDMRQRYPVYDTDPTVDVEAMDIPSAVIPQQSIGEREAWFDYLNERGFFDDFPYTPTPIDERTGDARIAEDIATENRLNPTYTGVNPFRTPYPPLDPYTGVNPFRTPYLPIELPIEEEEEVAYPGSYPGSY